MLDFGSNSVIDLCYSLDKIFLQIIMTHYSYPQYSHHSRNNERCKKCYKAIQPNHFLKEEICSSLYCLRCVCQIYQPHFLSNEEPIIVELYCGHFVDREVIQSIVKQNCINCGSPYDSHKDVEMKHGVKLCRSCFDYDSSKYKEFLMQCMSCNRIIRSLSFLANTEIVLCRDCATAQSNIQESMIRQQIPYNPKKAATHKQMLKKKQEQDEPEKDISIVSRFSAFQSSDNDIKGEDEPGKAKKIKMTSKHSVEVRVENFKISIQHDQQSRQRCVTCNCLITEPGLIPKDINKQCQICFMQNFDPRDTGTGKLFARSSAETSRNKFTSAPKNKGLDIPVESVRTMKKSYVFEPANSKVHPMSLLEQHLKSSIAAKTEKSLQAWQKPLVQSQKICEICKTNKYMIIRSDKKKVCSGCYSKK